MGCTCRKLIVRFEHEEIHKCLNPDVKILVFQVYGSANLYYIYAQDELLGVLE